MTIETTPAYITTVGPDHTIVLPDDIAVGATVAVVLMSNVPGDDEGRQARFAATLAAIRAASIGEGPLPSIADEDLEVLVKKARRELKS
ncbi:MAG: hypothetical protein L6R45_35435 [Anaerolineae bacterium]|nr:hypothetical protein [Anaerolineae bacterium]